MATPSATACKCAAMKKVSSPQNFIVKHAKVHRCQIERDNIEVKALFSYLSRIYRVGCSAESASDDNGLSLCESGLVPLRTLLGSIPGVDIKYQELPLISPFTAAMLYLESVGMGFDSIQFKADISEAVAHNSIVSTDASDSGTRGQKDENEFRLPQTNGMSTVEEDHQHSCDDELLVSTDFERRKLKDSCFDDDLHKDSFDDNGKLILQSCTPSTFGNEIKTCRDIPDMLTTCDFTSGLDRNPKEQIDSGLSYSDQSLEAISAFLRVEMPTTHAVDAAIDYLESQTMTMRAPSMNTVEAKVQELLTTTTDPLNNAVVTGFSSNCSIQDGSSSASTSTPTWTPASHVEMPGMSSFFSLSPSLLLADVEEMTSEYTLEQPTKHTALSDSVTVTAATGTESLGGIMKTITSSNSKTDCTEGQEQQERVRSALYTAVDLRTQIPIFSIQSLNLSPTEAEDLKEKFSSISGSDIESCDRLWCVESAVKYLEEVALNKGQNEDEEDSSLSVVGKECCLARTALDFLSSTLLISSRVLDLQNYPFWGSDQAPLSDVTVSVCATPLENHLRSFAEDLSRKMSGSHAEDIVAPRVSDWMSAFPLNLVEGDKIAPPVNDFTHPSDFLNMSDTSGAVALLALMADCVCSSEFDCYFEEKSTSILRRRDRDREIVPSDAKRRKILGDDHNSGQFISKRQQRCPKCGEFKKGHTCRFAKDAEPPSPQREV